MKCVWLGFGTLSQRHIMQYVPTQGAAPLPIDISGHIFDFACSSVIGPPTDGLG